MKRLYNDILIREACTDDAQQLCSWWNDGKVMAHARFPYGLGTTVETVRQQLEDKNNNSNRHIIIYKNIPIGEMNYCEAGEKNCEIGIKICDFSMQNKGLGKIILSLFIDAMFNEYGYEKILLDTNLNNKRAQHVYEQLGFKKVRTKENVWTDQAGVLQSFVDYELTRDLFVPHLN